MGLALHLRAIAAVITCFIMVVAVGNLTTFNVDFSMFNSSCYDIFKFENAALISGDTSIELTGLDPPFSNLSGRATLKKPFKLWEHGHDRVASFNSSFLFNIAAYFSPRSHGEGVAFLIASNTSAPLDSFGQYLGLTNTTTDGSPENQLVAIELDNVQQDFDPDANHVGLNINSVISNVTASLSPLGFDITSVDQDWYYNVWVQYDGVHKVIEVYIARGNISYNESTGHFNTTIPSLPDTPILKSKLDLRDVLNQYSFFGFSASTGSGSQYNSIYLWNLTVESFLEDLAPEHKHTSWEKTLLIVWVGVPMLVMMAAVIWYYYLCKKRPMAQANSDFLLGTLKRLPGTPREFLFKDLKKATNNFDEKQKLGQGGFGVVYQGHLQNENMEVAVKRFSRGTIRSQVDFLAELTIINRLRHKHLVRLLGWCHEEGKLLLVYDYMPNGSLDSHLFVKTLDSQPLSWVLRYKIISGVALALHYLHNEYDQRVIHQDIKASNIMLDSDFNARLGDFGLARALDEDKTWYTEAGGVAGTPGYIAPECLHTFRANQKSDVYAFGVVTLEIVCGLRVGTTIGEFDFLVNWVWSLHGEDRILDAVDKRLGNEYVIEEAKKMLLLALACCQPIASERPKTQEIVQIISGLAQVPFLPPTQPAFVWPATPFVEEDDISYSASFIETRTFRMTQSISGGFSQQHFSQDPCMDDKQKHYIQRNFTHK